MDHAVLNETEATATYDWMAGESPVENHRMGTIRYGTNLVDHAVSPTGIYFIPDVYTGQGTDQQLSDDTFLMYSDNGSSGFYKLCGRSDCPHDNSDCNAYLYRGSDLTYYQGKIYAVVGEGPHTKECKLVKMEPDGSQHETLLDLQDFAKDNNGDFVLCSFISDGYYIFVLYTWEEQGDGTYRETWLNTYKYKLDGSMKEPKLMADPPDILYQCGKNLISLTYEIVDDVEYKKCSVVDLETEKQTVLTEHPGVPAWFGEEDAYYFKNGAIRRFNYETKEEMIIVETGLEGKYFCFVFPDCLILASQNDEDGADRNLYFYNWEFELVDTVQLDYFFTGRTQFAVIAETVDRIFLTDEIDGKPLYYINKAELGTREARVHAFS